MSKSSELELSKSGLCGYFMNGKCDFLALKPRYVIGFPPSLAREEAIEDVMGHQRVTSYICGATREATSTDRIARVQMQDCDSYGFPPSPELQVLY